MFMHSQMFIIFACPKLYQKIMVSAFHLPLHIKFQTCYISTLKIIEDFTVYRFSVLFNCCRNISKCGQEVLIILKHENHPWSLPLGISLVEHREDNYHSINDQWNNRGRNKAVFKVNLSISYWNFLRKYQHLTLIDIYIYI